MYSTLNWTLILYGSWTLRVTNHITSRASIKTFQNMGKGLKSILVSVRYLTEVFRYGILLLQFSKFVMRKNLLKVVTNKKGRMFVWDASKMVPFLQLAVKFRVTSLEHLSLSEFSGE